MAIPPLPPTEQMSHKEKVSINWQCYVCTHEYSTEHDYEKLEEGEFPKGPPCPNCGSGYPNYQNLEIERES